ncbi:hypothetical protein Q3G72_020641 [Acer saccharum]|nr:hypothetical protein Q3G72_020641 [Acer saccharum]
MSRLVPLNSAEAYEKALRDGLKKGGIAIVINERAYMEVFLSNRCEFSIIGQEFTRIGWGFRLGFKLPDDDDVSARAHFLLERIKEKLKIEQEQEPKPKPEPEPEVRILIILDDVWEGIELGRVGIPFASKGLDEARCRIHALVSILIASFLLIPGKNEKHVKMHDVIRDFAIKLSKDERMFMVKAGIQLQNWPSADTFENFTGISLMYNDIRESTCTPLIGTLGSWTLSYRSCLERPPCTLLLKSEDATLAVSLGRAILSIRMPFLNSTSFDSFVIKLGYKSSMLFEESPPWSRILYLAGINNYQELDWAYSLTKITDALQLCGIAGLRNILTDLRKDGFNDLKYLLVAACREIKYLVNTLECTPKCIVFNSLKSLLMNHMELVEICHGPLPAESFLKLKQMHLRFCFKMLNIVPSDLLQRLHSLESFEARGCLSVVYVFDFERLVIAKEETKFLSSLNHLKLWSLSNMMRIWNGDAKLISLCNLKLVSVHYCSKLRQVFPPALLQSLVSLEHMEIESCSSLVEIFGNEEEEEEDHQENEIVSLKIDHTATSPRLGNLVSIKISGCHKLKNLFTPSIAKGLVQLRTLEVKLCRTLEEIISYEKAETGGSTDRITFPSLYQIDLGELDSLTCFCARRCTIEFPALELLDIESCLKMETFGRGDQAVTPLVNMILLDGETRWMGNLNITLQQFFMEKQINTFHRWKSESYNGSRIVSGLYHRFWSCRRRLVRKNKSEMIMDVVASVPGLWSFSGFGNVKVETFLADENKANKKCLKGWCINFRSCYRFSKEALRKIEDISQLLAKDFEAVSHPDPTPRTLPLAKGSSDAYESRRSLKKQVIEALNDENVSMIGICGLKKLELLYIAIGSKKLDFEQGGDSSSNARVTELQALEIISIDECPKMKMFGYGDQITPKLKKVIQGTKEHWFGSLNLTVQQLFKEEQFSLKSLLKS